MQYIGEIRCVSDGSLVTYTQIKSGLSPLSAKFHYCPCSIHYVPREIASDPEKFNEIYPYPCAIDADDAWKFLQARVEAEGEKPWLAAFAGLA